MQIQITQQERKLLQDHTRHEEVCINKYEQYAQQASDPQLRNMFSQFASQERQHRDSLDKLLQGQQPGTGGSVRQGQTSVRRHKRTETAGADPEGDALMCRDAMMMEKFISDSYDTGIFSSANPVVRQTLQHIQDEEQQHGEGLLNYLQEHGMKGG
ncbi:MAG: ferritin-like domain-containing protein [Bacillota bacterium]